VDVRLSGLLTGADGGFATGRSRRAGRTEDATGGGAGAPVIESTGSWSKGRVLPRESERCRCDANATLTEVMRVLIATKPVDFRKGGDGLVALVRETLGHDPFSGTIYVFRSKRADRVKMLAWDGSGLVLLWKLIENGAFKWPPITDGVMRLTSAQLAALVDGFVAATPACAVRPTIRTARS
jgi:transposase